MSALPFPLLGFACLLLWAAIRSIASPPPPLSWQALAPIPDPEGFAFPFAGVANGRLIVAGGANFPDKRPWEGGTKVWYDQVWCLDHPEGNWRQIGRLPKPLGYGVSLTVSEGVLCLGGSDAAGHYDTCFLLRVDAQGRPQTDPLPSLPRPCAQFCGALIGRVVFVAGGLEKPDAVEALRTFWTLDLDHLDRGWQSLPPWPGEGRLLATAGTLDGRVYLVGGAALKPDLDGKAQRVWLRDAWRYTPGQGWEALADLPGAAVAAPTPMPLHAGRLLLLGGDDGAQIHLPPEQHQGFSKVILAYDPASHAWLPGGTLPLGLVTTPSVVWRDHLILPGGEKKPGFRSTEVWALPIARP